MANHIKIALAFGGLRIVTQDAQFDIWESFWNNVRLTGPCDVGSWRLSATLTFRAYVESSLEFLESETRPAEMQQVGFFNFLTAEIIQSRHQVLLASNYLDVIDFVSSAIVDACELQDIILSKYSPDPIEALEEVERREAVRAPYYRLSDALPRIRGHVLLDDNEGMLVQADLRFVLTRRLPEHGFIGHVDHEEGDAIEFYRDLGEALEQACSDAWSPTVEVSFSLTELLRVFGQSVYEKSGDGLILQSRHVLVALYEFLDALSDVMQKPAADWIGTEITKRQRPTNPPTPQLPDRHSSSYNPTYEEKIGRLQPFRQHAERQRRKLEFRFENQALTVLERGPVRRERLLLCLTAERGLDKESRTVGTFGVSTETLDSKAYDGVVFCIADVESYLDVPMRKVREAILKSNRSPQADTYSFRVYVDEANRNATFFSPKGSQTINISRHLIVNA